MKVVLRRCEHCAQVYKVLVPAAGNPVDAGNRETGKVYRFPDKAAVQRAGRG